jgi:hypothetical protein
VGAGDALAAIARETFAAFEPAKSETAPAVVRERLSNGRERRVSSHRAWVLLRIPRERFLLDETSLLTKVEALAAESQSGAAIDLLAALVRRPPPRADLLRRLYALSKSSSRLDRALEAGRDLLAVVPVGERAGIEKDLSQLEAAAAPGDAFDRIATRLRSIVVAHRDDEVLRLEAFEEETPRGSTVVYTAWTARRFRYYSIEADRDSLSLMPAFEEYRGDRIGDDEASISFALEAGQIVGGRLFVLLAATEDLPIFRPTEFTRDAVRRNAPDSAGVGAADGAGQVLDALEKALREKRLFAGAFSFMVKA